MPKVTSKKRLVSPRSLAGLYRARSDALKRVIALCGQGEDHDFEELNKAIDVLVVAHIAVTFEWASSSLLNE